MNIGIEARVLAEIRHSFHREPELSGAETATASRVAEILSSYAPSKVITDLGGHGVAAEFKGTSAGPRILLRCDIDALPIREDLNIPHISVRSGVSHKCGHDGHTTILLGVAERLSGHPPESGTVILLFQPAEETGQGAGMVLCDPRFAEMEPSMAFALHNLPGYPLGSVLLTRGTFASASRGMVVDLVGKTSHASEPHLGRSPAMAVAKMIEAFSDFPRNPLSAGNGATATVIHARIGEEAFGTTPGRGRILITLRARDDQTMSVLAGNAAGLVSEIAGVHGLEPAISWTEEFPATVNHPVAVSIVSLCARKLGMEVILREEPFPWSEDFGHYGSLFPAALFGLGAGVEHPALHSPEYDFPDELLVPGVDLLMEIIDRALYERM